MDQKEKDDFIDQLLKTHDYFVKVEKSPHGVIVNFAGKKTCEYTINPIGDSQFVTLNYNKEIIPLQAEVVRLHIILDVYRQCKLMELSPNIVRFLDHDTQVPLEKLISLQLSPDEVEREKLINQYVWKILQDKKHPHKYDEELSEKNLLQTMNMLKGLLV